MYSWKTQCYGWPGSLIGKLIKLFLKKKILSWTKIRNISIFVSPQVNDNTIQRKWQTTIKFELGVHH